VNLCHSNDHNHSLPRAFSEASRVWASAFKAEQQRRTPKRGCEFDALSVLAVWNAPVLRRLGFPAQRQKAGKGGIGSITPLLRIPSVPAALPALAAPRQLATLLFFVANKPVAVCAWLVLGAAVPWNLYRLKSDKRNLDWRIVCRFIAPFLVSRFSPAKRRQDGSAGGSTFAFQIGEELLSLPIPSEGEATLRRCATRSVAVWKAAVPSLKS
jgi:hypothetical protein